jgi:hypothetical protein
VAASPSDLIIIIIFDSRLRVKLDAVARAASDFELPFGALPPLSAASSSTVAASIRRSPGIKFFSRNQTMLWS